MRKLTVLLMALAGALTAVVATVVLPPPVTLAAAPNQSLDIDAMHRAAPGILPLFDDVYQRHTGVLDVLKTP